jgi:hypothetical protein
LLRDVRFVRKGTVSVQETLLCRAGRKSDNFAPESPDMMSHLRLSRYQKTQKTYSTFYGGLRIFIPSDRHD